MPPLRGETQGLQRDLAPGTGALVEQCSAPVWARGPRLKVQQEDSRARQTRSAGPRGWTADPSAQGLTSPSWGGEQMQRGRPQAQSCLPGPGAAGWGAPERGWLMPHLHHLCTGSKWGPWGGTPATETRQEADKKRRTPGQTDPARESSWWGGRSGEGAGERGGRMWLRAGPQAGRGGLGGGGPRNSPQQNRTTPHAFRPCSPTWRPRRFEFASFFKCFHTHTKGKE